jgi:hypothetical protein
MDRDLKVDQEICAHFDKLVKQGAYEMGSPATRESVREILKFALIANKGWPHAIERALKAEALAQKLLDVLGRVIPSYLVGRLELDLDSVPEATVVRGEWKLYGNDDDSGMSYWCTVCNFQLSEDLFYSGYKNGRWIENGVFKYCPNCGAKMKVK